MDDPATRATRKQVDALIASLGDAVGVPDLALKDDACGLTFDDIAVTLAYDAEAGAMILTTVVEALDAKPEADALVRLLELNSILFNHEASVIGYDRDELEIFQLFRISAVDLSRERFIRWLERSLSLIETTREAIANALVAQPEEEDDFEERMSFLRP